VELTHASWFSGAGGLDLGLERAGWRTVSVSEIDPYASAILAERWPGVPNLGDILAEPEPPDATLWSGGFPCQDLSIAGKRRGFRGKRSSLAFAFLDLVATYRPPVILLENVPGLLSSHGGRDMAALLGQVAELGYGVAYRVLDARFFGVPQRRSRVFIVGLRSGAADADGYLAALRAAEVLAVGTRCGRHPPTGIEAWEEPAAGARTGLDIAGGLTRRYGKGVNTTIDDGAVVIGAPLDPGGVREADGLARRLDDRERVEGQEWVGSLRANSGGWRPRAEEHPDMTVGPAGPDDPLLPPGLDSQRYRACGNGVVSNVAEWIGRRLIEVLPAAYSAEVE